ncbi:MAG: YncE family protein [Longimicrobiales bacterium]|nr:YncE family protein [Longimicrobiales bacterium]
MLPAAAPRPAFAAALLPAAALLLAAAAPGALVAAVQAPPEADAFPVRASLDVGLNPHQIAFSEDGRTAWIAAAGSDAVTVVDVPGLRVVGSIPVPGVPLGVVPTPDGLDLAVARFGAGGVVRLARSGSPLGGDRLTGAGASLLAGPYAGGRYLLSVESADSVYVFDAAGFTFRAAYPVGRRPFPGAATSDFRKAFVPGYDDGTVTVVDLYNGRVVEQVRVGANPSGGSVLPGDEEYAVVVRGEDRVVLINTASHRITGEIRDGIGSSPFSLVVAPNGRLGFVNNTASHDVSVIDLEGRRVIARLPLPEQPIVMAVHPSGETLWVASEGEDRLTVREIPAAFRDNPRDRPAERYRGGAPAEPGAPAPVARPTEVAVMGMIHGAHRISERWGIAQVMATIEAFRPDVVCAEIAPDRWAHIEVDLRERGVIEDPRVLRFPEYVDEGAILPRMEELGYRVAPCAGWSQEMSDRRTGIIRDFATSPATAPLQAEYDGAVAAALAALPEPQLAEDDPRYIHSAAYDTRQKARLALYDRYQNDVIGPGGWTNINVAHYRLIDRVIRENPGRRILVTFGGGHKYWFLERLRARDDVTLLELGPFLPSR